MQENDPTYSSANGSMDPANDAFVEHSRFPDKSEVDTPEVDPQDPHPSHVPVVGLGGSSGSLDGLRKFFSKIPQNTGIAYVVVVHLSPEHESALASILQRSSTIPVTQVSEPVKLEPDHAYVIPPGKHLAMADGVVQVLDMTRPKGRHVTVDLFFRTLAEAHGPDATAIVLSGGDGDGAMGLKRVKERGGLTVVQEPKEAQFEGMPRAAIDTGMVDWILPVEEIPARLVEYREHGKRIGIPSHAKSNSAEDHCEEQEEVPLREILF